MRQYKGVIPTIMMAQILQLKTNQFKIPLELEIIRRIAEGLTNKKNANRFFLRMHTVHAHRKNIMKEL